MWLKYDFTQHLDKMAVSLRVFCFVFFAAVFQLKVAGSYNAKCFSLLTLNTFGRWMRPMRERKPP